MGNWLDRHVPSPLQKRFHGSMIQYFQPCSGSIAITTDKNYTGSSITASGLLFNTSGIPLLFSSQIGVATVWWRCSWGWGYNSLGDGHGMGGWPVRSKRGPCVVSARQLRWSLPPAANVNGDELQYSFHHGERSVVRRRKRWQTAASTNIYKTHCLESLGQLRSLHMTTVIILVGWQKRKTR